MITLAGAIRLPVPAGWITPTPPRKESNNILTLAAPDTRGTAPPGRICRVKDALTPIKFPKSPSVAFISVALIIEASTEKQTGVNQGFVWGAPAPTFRSNRFIAVDGRIS
jgi:hypothetical protein